MDIQRCRFRTKSFAPRFKNRAPAKYLERLAMTVIYTVRPYIDRAVAGQQSQSNRGIHIPAWSIYPWITGMHQSYVFFRAAVAGDKR
jgi:hypothetical protein